ncbi:hypothetical protein ACFE04_007934 [Oxalis oulophora]
MKNSLNRVNNSNNQKNNNSNRFRPTLKFISSCIKTASSGVRSASASVTASLSQDQHKDKVFWASFDRLEFGPSFFKNVLLLGYSNGFQVLDVEDASSVSELVSRRDDPVTFLQMQPIPVKSDGQEGFRDSHPLLLVVCDESRSSVTAQDGFVRNGYEDPQTGNADVLSPTVVRFYSLRSHNYVHVLRFRSTIYMVRCSPRIVAVGLSAQIYCFDALTLENKFSVLTYPVPQLGGQCIPGVNIGYGPMGLGPRWLAYAPNSPLQSNSGRLSPHSLTSSPGVSPSTSPGNGNLVARYAMESSKQLATGLINLGDLGYRTLSRYCQDRIPDGSSSPLSSPSSWKSGRSVLHPGETDLAGTVVIKDVISRAVVSQFRAHNSPISALCFDPSGTLLVTASIHGNNINIFRIMPATSKHGSTGTQCYEWSSSHVHLYKLHRGMTSAVIQDICFSQYSQWVSILTSRGTCHIFVISPFGGENVLQIQKSNGEGPTHRPVLSLPWWSSPSFMVNNRCFSSPPPPPVTLSVVSRLKDSNSGWINTVSNAATSATGKASRVPSGALSAVFHSSLRSDFQSKSSALEHLVVYTPSGHLVQHKLLSSTWGESNEESDDELGVKVEAVDWWDVCRGTDWPEREEHVSDCKDNDVECRESVKFNERPHLYLSNAEVMINSGRRPIWQRSKISFYMTSLQRADEHGDHEDHSGGELEIENFSVREVEIRRKDLLPVFEHFPRIQSDWSDSGITGSRYSISPSNSSDVARENLSEEAIVSQSKLLLAASVENSNIGSSGNFYPSLVQSGSENEGIKGLLLSHSSVNKDKCTVVVSPVEDSNCTNGLSSLTSDGANDVSNTSSNRSDSSMNILDEGPVNDSPDFEPFFQDGYCNASTLDKCKSTDFVADVDGNRTCDGEKSDDDEDNDDMLGGVFAFSEEVDNLADFIAAEANVWLPLLILM